MENIVTITIEKGKGVISAIRSVFPNLSKGEILSRAKAACRELKGKIRENDICTTVQPGQVITIKDEKNLGKTEILEGYDGLGLFSKNTDQDGNTKYILNGKEIPKIKRIS